MSQSLDNIIGNFENKLRQTADIIYKLQQENIKLNKELLKEKKYNRTLEEENENLIKQSLLLKNANALLGSDKFKTETRYKINALIKQIDQCIAQLS